MAASAPQSVIVALPHPGWRGGAAPPLHPRDDSWVKRPPKGPRFLVPPTPDRACPDTFSRPHPARAMSARPSRWGKRKATRAGAGTGGRVLTANWRPGNPVPWPRRGSVAAHQSPAATVYTWEGSSDTATRLRLEHAALDARGGRRRPPPCRSTTAGTPAGRRPAPALAQRPAGRRLTMTAPRRVIPALVVVAVALVAAADAWPPAGRLLRRHRRPAARRARADRRALAPIFPPTTCAVASWPWTTRSASAARPWTGSSLRAALPAAGASAVAAASSCRAPVLGGALLRPCQRRSLRPPASPAQRVTWRPLELGADLAEVTLGCRAGTPRGRAPGALPARGDQGRRRGCRPDSAARRPRRCRSSPGASRGGWGGWRARGR